MLEWDSIAQVAEFIGKRRVVYLIGAGRAMQMRHADMTDAINALKDGITEDMVVVYGGDPFEEGVTDVAAVVRQLYVLSGGKLDVIAIQSASFRDGFKDPSRYDFVRGVFFFPDDCVNGKTVYSGYLNIDTREIAGTLKRVVELGCDRVLVLSGGTAAADELHYFYEGQYDVIFHRVEPRFPLAEDRLDGACAAVKKLTGKEPDREFVRTHGPAAALAASCNGLRFIDNI